MTQGQLNAGHLGGRFLKRAIPQKVKPVPSCATELDMMTGQPRQALSDTNRRARTSAAMIGLAISVGAHSFLLPHQGDEAVAAEPVASEPTVSAIPKALNVASLSPTGVQPLADQSGSTAKALIVEHTVQEGQTLWQLARFYGVDTVTVATANNIPLDAVLHVGQVLQIPTDGRVASARLSVASLDKVPEYYGAVSPTPAVPEANQSALGHDAALKVEQAGAIARLQQKRDSLRLSLRQLQSDLPSAKSGNDKSGGSAAVETVQPVAESKSPIYRVTPGDTLSAIAKIHGVSQAELQAANRLSDPNVLFVNQVLTLPQRETGVSPRMANVDISALPSGESVIPVVNAATSSAQLGVPKITSGMLQVDASSTNRSMLSLPLTQTKQVRSDVGVKIASLPATAPETAQAPDVTLATAPLAGNEQPTQVVEAEPKLRHSYVENLRLEIVRLREKYQSGATTLQTRVQPMAKVAAASLNPTSDSDAVTVRINPEFSPNGYSETVRSQVRKLQAKVRPLADSPSVPAAVVNQRESELVATASVGSQNYDPILPSVLGQMVSPNLPPLGSVDAYLPGKSGKFNGYMWPAKGLLTSGYGWRWGRMHKGIDIAAPIGTPVVAAAPGVVVTAGWNSGGYGNLVEIQHPDGSVTLYAHNNRILVREGQQVAQGEQIAEMGSTGYSTGPHSHFEVHLPGQGAVNPIGFLPRESA